MTEYCGSLVKVRLILVLSIEPLFNLLEFNFFVLEVQFSSPSQRGAHCLWSCICICASLLNLAYACGR